MRKEKSNGPEKFFSDREIGKTPCVQSVAQEERDKSDFRVELDNVQNGLEVLYGQLHSLHARLDPILKPNQVEKACNDVCTEARAISSPLASELASINTRINVLQVYIDSILIRLDL